MRSKKQVRRRGTTVETVLASASSCRDRRHGSPDRVFYFQNSKTQKLDVRQSRAGCCDLAYVIDPGRWCGFGCWGPCPKARASHTSTDAVVDVAKKQRARARHGYRLRKLPDASMSPRPSEDTVTRLLRGQVFTFWRRARASPLVGEGDYLA